MTDGWKPDRRTVLGLIGVGVATGSPGCLTGDDSAAPSTGTRSPAPADGQSGTATTTPTVTGPSPTGEGGEPLSSPIELGARIAGWVGTVPSPIADERNPTLRLAAGRPYELVLENLDGLEHELKIEDASGEDVIGSESIEDVGERTRVRFTARASFREYYCEYHESSMRGRVVVE